MNKDTRLPVSHYWGSHCPCLFRLRRRREIKNSLSLFYAVTNGSSHSPTALNGAPSPPNGYSNGPSSSSSSSLANQQLPPACGARQLSKLKRFLTTLQQFGNDISPEIGERVRTLVLGLVVSSLKG
ncbi:Protein CBFA2T1 [Goodea atripinnis]|uniref:Protein CBFA2T1 n=1 Tax=Goodea atripinnis TaxID=208336 RepID=A0ABV0P3M2_9TELE